MILVARRGYDQRAVVGMVVFWRGQYFQLPDRWQQTPARDCLRGSAAAC
jgi:hypothetical protein